MNHKPMTPKKRMPIHLHIATPNPFLYHVRSDPSPCDEPYPEICLPPRDGNAQIQLGANAGDCSGQTTGVVLPTE